MSKQMGDKMYRLKKVFVILLFLDVIELLLSGAALYPTFWELAGDGQFMLVVMSVMAAVIVAVSLFEILAKLFLLRSTSPTFSWASGRKGYLTAAKLLVFFNLCAVIFNMLAVGGEGATLINQARIYLQILASAVEMIAAFSYLRIVKRLVLEIKENTY